MVQGEQKHILSFLYNDYILHLGLIQIEVRPVTIRNNSSSVEIISTEITQEGSSGIFPLGSFLLLPRDNDT